MTLRIACPSGHSVILSADKLGTEVACPHCLTTFRAEMQCDLRHHARKEDKARRTRDDEDEEDDDDEKPQKKVKKSKDDDKKIKGKARKPKEEDEDEKPRKKKARKETEDDDEEDEEDEEEEEEEEPIEWTPRKRQLKLCSIGLMIMMGAFCVLMLFSFVMMLALDYYTFDAMNYVSTKEGKIEGAYTDSFETFGYVAGPFVGLVQLVLLVGLFLSLFSVPAKVEGRGPIIGALVFGGLVFLAGILIIVYGTGATGSDPVRTLRMIQLMGGGAGLCFIIGTLSTMAYHGKLLHFMNLRMESSQPITNTLFYYLYFAGAFVLFLATPYICSYMFPFFGWGVLLGIDAVFALAIRQLIAQAKMFLLAKRAIDKYIREG